MGALAPVRLRRRVAAATAVALGAALAAVPVARAAAPAPLRFSDDRGAAIVLPAPPQRLVSLVPSLTETVCALGACARLVATDQHSNWPALVAGLPKVGSLDTAAIERIVALRPDAVLVSTATRATDRLAALGLRVIALEAASHADVQRVLERVALIVDGDARAGRVLWLALQARLAAAAARVPPAARGWRAYVEIDATPFAAGAASFIGETLARLGVGNIAAPELGPFPQLAPEFIVRAQPDVVIAARANLSAMPARPGWRTLRALAGGRACGFAPDEMDVLARPGPRLGDAADLLADCLHRLAAREAGR